MAAIDRINPVIKLTSPSGNVFEAKWLGSNRQVTKKIGKFDYPKFPGSITQDLNVESTIYPMKIYFDGRDHDKDANNFLDAIKEIGQWEVIHPLTVIGQIVLQPLSIEPIDDPVNSGNVTEINTEWIEPANIEIILSADFLSTSILDDALDAVESVADTFSEIKQALFAPIQAVRNMIDKTTTIINTATNILSSTVADINNEVNQITRSISSLLDAVILAPLEIANSIYQLANLPSLVSNNFQAMFENYEKIANDLIGLEISSTDIGDEGFNTVKSQEMALSMALITVATITAQAEFNTRAQVVDAIDKITTLTNSITASVDTQQEYFDNLDLDKQFFKMTQSYNSILLLISKSLQLLTQASFNLKTEKRFTLDIERSPLDITIAEYGNFGDNDENLTLFNNSNKLQGNHLELIPAGTEVVVYVG